MRLLNHSFAPQLCLAATLGFGLTHCKSSTGSGSQTASATAPNSPSTVDLSVPTPAAWQTAESAELTVDQFHLLTFPSTEIEKHMPPGSAAQQVPAQLQGIWWMDGNTLAPGNVVSFAKSMWDLPNHRFLLQEYGLFAYTVDATPKGTSSFTSSVNGNVCFEVTMSADYQSGQLIQTNRIPKTQLRIKIDKAVINYQMQLVADGDYLRTSWWGIARLPDYHLRRIVDANGQHIEPAYSNWLKVAPVQSMMPDAMTGTSSTDATDSTNDPTSGVGPAATGPDPAAVPATSP